MSAREMFRTKRGSIYLEEDGEWTRRKYNGEVSNDYVYIGSINADKNPAWESEGGYSSFDVQMQISSGRVPGFTPKFKIGNNPLGLSGNVRYRTGRGKVEVEGKIDRFHIGERITELSD